MSGGMRHGLPDRDRSARLPCGTPVSELDIAGEPSRARREVEMEPSASTLVDR